MKHHLNTLYVTTQGAYLAKDGLALAVKLERQVKLRVPLHNLESIVCFGRIGVSPQLMAACAESGVAISLLSEQGRFRAAIVGFSPGNVLLRRQQYRLADDLSNSCKVARQMIAAKIANCRAVLLRAARDAASGATRDSLQKAANRLIPALDSARRCENLEALRGLEGEAANTYFAAFEYLINANQSAFAFRGRSRRPPLDPLNALLSFIYTLLTHDARSACEATGLDAAVGLLHRDRPGRPGLALDLIEEFRPFLADRLALSLINRRQVVPEGFTTLPSGAVQMDERTRKTVLVAWQKRKQDVIAHPFLGEKMTLGLLLHMQARLLARHIRGDLDAYPPFVWR